MSGSRKTQASLTGVLRVRSSRVQGGGVWIEVKPGIERVECWNGIEVGEVELTSS